ncbi:closca [Leptinotarsa decemlineata]|uniref:closca n=1 Tax=Leptinotarsa decemlineata TaxID=7539 RepID=UPI003D30D415
MIRINSVVVILLFINLILLHNNFASNQPENNVDELTENLIENLRADPSLEGDFIISEASKEFIDKHIENYMKLVLETQEKEFSRSKRSLPENETSLQDFYVDLRIYKNISNSRSNDMVLFQQNSAWYVASLESNLMQPGKLIIRKYENDSFPIITEAEIWNGARIATFPSEPSTLIIVAENGTRSLGFEHRANIFQFTQKEELETVQKIEMEYAVDVTIWEDKQNIFMSVAQFMKEGPNRMTFRVKNPLYKWRGKHFDMIQRVKTSGCRRISPFSIGGVHFVALANSQADEGNKKIYSEILKYNVQTEKFEVFQRILTYACRDIRYFEIGINHEVEHFLIVANFEYEDGNENSGLPSIIYKFVDSYFIPFQSIKLKGVTQWEPIQESGNTLLVASTIDGMHFLHYDGWQFIESELSTQLQNVTKQRVESIRVYEFEGKHVIVSSSRNESNMFEITFLSKNKLKQEHDQLLNWCQENLNIIDSKDLLILGEKPRGDVIEVTDSASQTKMSTSDNLTLTLRTYQSKLSKMEDDIEKSLQLNKEHTIKGNITARNIILNVDAVLDSVHFHMINNIALNGILENSLNVNEGFSLDSRIEFDFLRSEEPLFPEKINGNPVDKILRTSDNSSVSSFTVIGNVNFTNDVTVKDEIDNATFSGESEMLLDGNQTSENISSSKNYAKNIETEDLNDHQLRMNEPDNVERAGNGKASVKNLNKLRVKNLVVSGFVNDLDLATLFKYALRKSGPQNITKTYFIDNLVADIINTDNISGKRVSTHLIPITGGNYTVNKDVMFTNDLSAKNLFAAEFLNDVIVRDGKLDILLKDSKVKQFVTGMKSFENLELLDAINLQGKIKGKPFDSMNPIVRVDSSLEKDEDVRITGDVIVEEVIILGDIVTADGKNSLLRLQKSGFKLNETVIPMRMRFSQHINVHELSADKINNIDPATWVVNGAKQIQIIPGWKQFVGDLEITGDTRVLRINDIDMTELETNVLKKEGDQVIRGKHYVKFVAVEKRLISRNTTFGPRPWKDVITTTGEQEITGTVLFRGNVSANFTTASTLKVDGLINDLNFSEITNDAVTVNTPFKVFGTKTFQNITVDELNIVDDFDFSQYLDPSRNVFIMKNLNNLENLTVENLHFSNKFNTVDQSSLLTSGEEENTTLIIDGDKNIERIVVYGNVFVESNRINHVDLEDFQFKTVKIDEPFHFDFVDFANDVIVSDTIALDGQIDNLDLENIFQNTGDVSDIIMDKKHFHKNVRIDGKVHIDGKLNEVNVSDLCNFASVDREGKKLVVEGNAHFAKGPHVLQFNGNNVHDLEKNVWFKDREAILKGDFDFKKNATFRDDIIVKGLINNVDINHLSQNYLSKTKRQNITAPITFKDGVVFEKVSVPELLVEGGVNDINLATFLNEILLHRPQLFEDQLYFEEIQTDSVTGTYLVNKLNLESDVMRYDKPNTITGPKRFKNLDIGILRSERNITVQDVDVNYWLTNAILKTAGTFSISGKKSFRNITAADGLSLVGYLNHIKINKNTVLLKNTPQTITGRKVFLPTSQGELKFKSLKVKGRVNDADIGELIDNQAHKNRDMVIKSPMNFHSNITTENVNFEKLYQGINVSELMMNITNLGSLSDFGSNYRSLLEMSTLVENSLRGQAYYLNYFKSISFIPRVNEIFSSRCNNEDNRIITFTCENGSAIINFLRWDEKQEMFLSTEDYSINLGRYPVYIKQIEMAGRDYVFIENEVEKSEEMKDDFTDHTHVGELIHFDQSTKFKHTTFLTKGTHFLTSFKIESMNSFCLLFIDFLLDMNILCLGADEEFYIHQRLESEKPFMASALSVAEHQYLITIRKEDPRTSIWKMNDKFKFEIYQTLYEGDPISLSSISCTHGAFVAVAYGHLLNTKEFGKVIIRRFDKNLEEFVIWQTIKLKTPVQIEFALLPTQELVLYITTENPAEPFNVYIYEGISDFSRNVGGSTIPNIINMNQFSLKNGHFVVVKHYYEIGVIQAVFKGSKPDF